MTAALHPDDIGSATRKNMRDALYDLSIMRRMVEDITALFSTSSDAGESYSDDLKLWDEKDGEVAAGKQYADESRG